MIGGAWIAAGVLLAAYAVVGFVLDCTLDEIESR